MPVIIEQEFEVDMVRTIRAKVRVSAASAAEIRRKFADESTYFAEDTFLNAPIDCDGVKVVSIKPVR